MIFKKTEFNKIFVLVFCRLRLHAFQDRKDAVTFLVIGCFESFQQNLGITRHVLSDH